MNGGCIEIRIFAKSQSVLDAVMTQSKATLNSEEWLKGYYTDSEMWKVLPLLTGSSWSHEQQKWLPNDITCYSATMLVFERLNLLSFFENAVVDALNAHTDQVFAVTRYCSGESMDPAGHFFKDTFEASSFSEFNGSNFELLAAWFEKWPEERVKRVIATVESVPRKEHTPSAKFTELKQTIWNMDSDGAPELAPIENDTAPSGYRHMEWEAYASPIDAEIDAQVMAIISRSKP